MNSGDVLVLVTAGITFAALSMLMAVALGVVDSMTLKGSGRGFWWRVRKWSLWVSMAISSGVSLLLAMAGTDAWRSIAMHATLFCCALIIWCHRKRFEFEVMDDATREAKLSAARR